MELIRKPRPGKEYKVFDPRDLATGTDGAELVDASVIRRQDRWWMYLAGQAAGYGAPRLYSASLAPGSGLSAIGWTLTRSGGGQLIPLGGHNAGRPWDEGGGRHCPSYVKGFDPDKRGWVERIYYAGAAKNVWGPYTIGFLEWDGEGWADQGAPAFIAAEDWEHGSVYEPNLVYYDGKWRMWYVAGSNQEDYLVQGYSESEDGRSDWTPHVMFAPPEMKMFDFCVRQRRGMFNAIFSRVSVAGSAAPHDTGLWWCEAGRPSPRLSDWSQPVQIMTAEDRGWHAGPWKPSLAVDEQDGENALLFFDGLYRTSDPGPFPFVFTLGCLEVSLPPASSGND